MTREQEVLAAVERRRRLKPKLRDERITLAHGAGGKATHALVEALFLEELGNPLLEPLADAAVFQAPEEVGPRLAFTTDSFVVRPLFFPGGDIGELAVNGTVNDLAMAGARPLALTLSLVLEEGLAADDLRAEVDAIARAEPGLDLLLLDLKMPGMSGMAGLVELRRRFPTLPVVIVSAAEDPAIVREALACGASGYIPKSLERRALTEALGQVLEGEVYVPPALRSQDAGEKGAGTGRLGSLTPQQLAVLRLMVEGKPNKIIAYELAIAETTVKAHITVILRKLGVHSRTQAVLFARDLVGAQA
jgi:DNA-binding NarL/FixJ family response regulator